MVTLQALRSFVALADALHFTRAADTLSVAQPALSKHIQQLEHTLGIPLFDRDRRSVRLTPAGELLLVKAKLVLASADDIADTARRLREGDMGQLRIGFTPSAPYHVLPTLMRAFTRKHPNVETVLTEASSEQQMQQLTAGALDLGILRPPRDCPSAIGYRVMLKEPFVVAVPRDHRLAARPRITLKELESEPLILIGRRAGATVHDDIIGAFHAQGLKPRIVREANHIHAIAALVGAGCGISVLAESVEHVRLPDVVYRPLSGTKLQAAMVLAYPAEHRSPIINAFLDVAAACAPHLRDRVARLK